MTWLDGYRMRLVLVGFVVAIGFGGGSARADFTFGEPTNLGIKINSGACDDALNISGDGLSIIFSSDRPDWGTWDLYMATREKTENEWAPAVKLGSTLNGPRSESYPSISADSLELFYTAPFWQSGWTELGGADLWVSRRSSVSGDWSVPENLGSAINTTFHDTEPSISSDSLELYFSSNRPGGRGQWNIWMTTRKTKDDPWQEPVNLGPTINSGSEGTPNISANGLVLFFASSRPGGHGEADIWLTKRKTKAEPWGEPVNLGQPINDSGGQWAPCFSHDNSTLYFTDDSKQPKQGCFDIWQMPVIPIVDFTGDDRVDIADLTILIEHWGQDESAYDMGPTPFGDGVIDTADLEVLMSYWGQEVYDPHLLAHWKLDETEGDVAYDSAADNDAVVIGDATWGPDNGTIAGALRFDGIDDYIDTLFKLDPADGVFSVFAWVKGGAPGQVILSQEGSTDWLLADTQGCLITALQSNSGRIKSGPLISKMFITDGNWHRVGFVRDGSERILYVDDIEVVRDTVNNLDSASGSLFIGVDSNLEADSFWSGMIDDVRIYDRVVAPYHGVFVPFLPSC